MNHTISEVESSASTLFEAIQALPLPEDLAEVRDFLFPRGFTPVVQLEQDGRKKRGSAAKWNWEAKTGEIRIYLELKSPSAIIQPDARDSRKTQELPATQIILSPKPQPTALGPTDQSVLNCMSRESSSELPAVALDRSDPPVDPISPDEVIECCQALAVAERSKRPFIALKWFRDEFLATVDYAWSKSPQRRQRVLSYAIDFGRIDLKKIPNPKSDFATSAISLNRSLPTPGVAPRFQPVPVRGEPVSATILRDRGNF